MKCSNNSPLKESSISEGIGFKKIIHSQSEPIEEEEIEDLDDKYQARDGSITPA